MVFFLFVCGPEKYGAETKQRECAYAECKSEAFQKPKLERSVEAEHSFFLEMKRKQTSSDERLYTETGLFVLEKLTLEGIIAANRASA